MALEKPRNSEECFAASLWPPCISFSVSLVFITVGVIVSHRLIYRSRKASSTLCMLMDRENRRFQITMETVKGMCWIVKIVW